MVPWRIFYIQAFFPSQFYMVKKRYIVLLKCFSFQESKFLGIIWGTQYGYVASLKKPLLEPLFFKKCKLRLIIHVLGSHKYNISGYAWRPCMCIFACEIPLLMLLASIFNSGSMHVCFRKGWGSVGAHHMDLVSGYLGKRVGVVRIMCPRAPYSYFSSSDYSLTLARLVAAAISDSVGAHACMSSPFPSCATACSDPLEPALTATALSLAGRNSCLH